MNKGFTFDLQRFAGVHGVATPGTNNPIYTTTIHRDRRDLDISNQIARLIPEATPFAVLLMRAKKKAAGTQHFFWFDSTLGGWWTQKDGAEVDPTETALVVTEASIFRARDLIKVPSTGEVMFVTAVDEAADTLTVVRGYGTTVAAAIGDEAWFMRLGNAMEQFSNAPDPKTSQPVRGMNITQIFRRPFDQSMTSESEDLKTNESERVRLRRDQAIEHRLDIERALLFGEFNDDVGNNRATTRGLLSFIGGRSVDAQGALSEEIFENYCEELFQYGSKTKLFVCSRRTGSLINAFARDRIETKSGEDTYGLRLKKFTSYHGDLYVVPSQTLENDYRGLGFGVDMDNVNYRPLKGRDTKLRTNIQANDADGWRDEYITEAGLQVRLPATHCVLENCDS